MRRALRSLRVRLALLGFVAIYLPTLLLFSVTQVTETQLSETRDGVEVTRETREGPSAWVTATLAALAPAAAGLAWWWAGRAVRPIDRIRAVAEEIEGTDLSRRIGLEDGPAELVALAGSFDAMLSRLESAAGAQRRLTDEASHELRNPLATLTTNADVLLSHPNPTPELYREGLERSRSVAERLRRTVDDLLADARERDRTIDRHPVDLMELAREVVEDARLRAATREVELALSGPATAVCPVDGPTVARAMSNLLDNAGRHAPEGTTVEVRVELTEGDAQIHVVDHGSGIPPAERDRVFERFWRGDHDSHGSGLGLPIARQIAAAHGGELNVASPGPAGDGCDFVLRLPRRR